jgi:hypothetical protein
MATLTTYIYALECPETKEIRYVGKADDLIARYRRHQWVGGSSEKRAWIRDLGKRGLRPNLLVLEEVPWDDWKDAEIRWISAFRDSGSPLFNEHDGGTGGNRIEYYGPQGKPQTSFMAWDHIPKFS